MKHITILFLAAGFLMAADCSKEFDKLDKDISKVKQAKKLNEAKLEYLTNLKSKIEANCVDGQINNLTLKEIKTTEKQAYELNKLNKDKAKLKSQEEKLKQKEDKLKAKEEKLKAKHDKELKKLEDKKAKAEKKGD